MPSELQPLLNTTQELRQEKMQCENELESLTAQLRYSIRFCVVWELCDLQNLKGNAINSNTRSSKLKRSKRERKKIQRCEKKLQSTKEAFLRAFLCLVFRNTFSLYHLISGIVWHESSASCYEGNITKGKDIEVFAFDSGSLTPYELTQHIWSKID